MPFRNKVALVWGGLATLLFLLKVIPFNDAVIFYALGFVWFIEEYMADTDKKLDEIIKKLEALDSQM
jgi:hypothetical protein